jgi:hypothetical protein
MSAEDWEKGRDDLGKEEVMAKTIVLLASGLLSRARRRNARHRKMSKQG